MAGARLHLAVARRHDAQLIAVSSDRLAQFEARLAALKSAMESGLGDRARGLRALADRVVQGDAAARAELKTEAHKLRGVAGTYGHADLTQAAGELEAQASLGEAELVRRTTYALAALAESKGQGSAPAAKRPTQQPAPASTPARAQRSVQPAAVADSDAQVDATRKLRVLAIDDDAVTQRLLALTLQQVGGFEATIVASAQAALALLEQHEYDVVVSDAMMPDMNGMEFRRVARARGLKLPIVMLSAASPDELGWTIKAEHAVDWLRKPFRPSELVRDLLRIAARHR